MKKLVSILLLFTFGLSSCEKDDICDANTPTTPRVVITFYKDIDPTTPAPVINMTVKGQDEENPIIFNENGTDGTEYLTSASTVSVPLRTDSDTTVYEFTFNANGTNRNTDILTFKYTRNNIYVSRACGFKTNFTLDPTGAVVRTDSDGLNWIQNITVLNRNIVSEDETHINIVY
ncbi:DUF6452 family protein [Flavobacterium quisquiliarum]|uniref:DUF6452 family protein n=1 Tax=Flavobacterium quisquiliarum TaxID=1834436 RepID=A0ABV8W930_9FLAO|nr:DUF6452 family protein [Flavobacterium quisquiliarum]MBW1656295.1 hypothetical protein [Flavobacterium quisquiliarum]NWL04039.1 hypothetical protein [Flavobacterium collinsii]